MEELFPPPTRKTKQVLYWISEPQLASIDRAASREQVWEGINALFVGLSLGALITCITTWSPVYGLISAGCGLVMVACQRQIRAWHRLREKTLEEVRLTEHTK